MLSAGEISTSVFGNIAIGGYDPVGYHLSGLSEKGKNDITHVWKGIEWRFSGKENRALFAAAPEKYAPRYGGIARTVCPMGRG